MWAVGLSLMVVLFLAIGALRRLVGAERWAAILQAVVLATSLVVGWSMVFVGGVFVVLWWLRRSTTAAGSIALRAQAGFRGLVGVAVDTVHGHGHDPETR